MTTYRLTIEYEGTRYRGWQEQKNARTVAGELKKAIERVAGPVEELGGSGRTDAGVHAAAQTAHLRLARSMDPEGLRRAVNELLPADIHLLATAMAPDRFHARHHAQSRSYMYQIALRRTAFAKRFVWWVRRPLALPRMQAAAALIPGRHDFVFFCERAQEQTSTIVVVEAAELVSFEGLILVRLVASHFLWRMVRRLVGALVEVGGGALDGESFGNLLEGREAPGRESAPAQWTAPPSGLFLERVIYPGDPPLPAIAPIVPVPAEPIAAEPLPGAPARASSPPGGRAPRAPRDGRTRPSPHDRPRR